MNLNLLGIHHLTAVTAAARQNHDFYTGTLGMRLVKKTVNQDDTSAYHLFYADGTATPGSDLTFFDWPTIPERRGSNSVVRTGLRVRGQESIRWWSESLRDSDMRQQEPVERDGRWTLDLEDPEGQRLSLIADSSGSPAHPWERSPIPEAHQILGLGPITMSVPDLNPTRETLTRVMNMREVREYTLPAGERSVAVHVFEMGPGGAAAELHVVVEPGLPPGRLGSGAVHHVAFRAPDNEHAEWAQHLRQMQVPFNGPIDRFYFRSHYFREPSGVLFEIASDGPGFAVDEPMETLGERLALPPFLEPRRAEIEAKLKPL